MKATVRPARGSDIARAVQLCQRTNQFNVTTKRYTDADLAGLLENPEAKVFLLQAEDRFGAMGLSGLIIWRKSDGAAEVDTFLMSCRIIGRGFDHALFAESLRVARESWGVEELRASFSPTPKNRIVADLWTSYGFSGTPADTGEKYVCSFSKLKVSFPETIELTRNP